MRRADRPLGTRLAALVATGISAVIAQVDDARTSIAAAVEEQTATVGEMDRSVVHASGGARQIAEDVAAIATSAGSTTTGVTEADAAIAEVSRMAVGPTTAVDRFRC